MGLINLIISPYITLLIPIYIALYYLLPYLTTYSSLSRYPGPFSAKFSNIWLGLSARSGRKYAAVDWAHRKYGKVVRVGFNHVSIADERALQTVYGHGNGFLKDHFYEAFVVGTTGLFNTRDRTDHTRKRKIIAHAFSPKSVSEFEPHMTSNLVRWVQELDKISNSSSTTTTTASSSTANQNHNTHSRQFAKFNAMPWFSYLAFDIIGDLAFGSPFGMVVKGRDETEVQLTPGGPISYAPAVEVLNRRGEVSSTLGLLPFLRPYAQYLPDPFFTKGISAVKNLNGIAVAAVRSRIDAAEKGQVVGNEDRNDILARLLQSKDSKGQKMGRTEVTAEALTQLIAGSDTVSNTSCAIFYYILHGERAAPGSIIPRLQEELDAAIPANTEVASYSMVRNLPFLRRCIDEGMRLHSTSAIGLPRIVAPGPGVDFDTYGNGEEIVHFPPGTVLSVPSYTIHHLAEIWGPDVEEFKPDRWLCLNERQKTAFNPFSYGPRACVGQNVAIMELQLIIGTVFRRYDFELYQPVLESHEGFSKKPKECFAGIRRRGI